MAKAKRRPTTDAVEILHRRYYEGKPERLAALEMARANDHVARKIFALRTEAGLSQRQLARLIGTTASVICRLEDADYEGHSLAMLNRIAAALNRRVEIRFVPAEKRAQSA
jgi:ribosome-binding protein aMBF1 (putative translation factor)